MRASAKASILAALAIACSQSICCLAQQRRVYQDADYRQAERFMDYNVNPLVLHSVENPVWLPDGRLWFRDVGQQGVTFVLVDPSKRTVQPAFDQAILAAALNRATAARQLRPTWSTPVDPAHLPIDDFTLQDQDSVLLIVMGGQRIRCEMRGVTTCQPAAALLPPTDDVSPDGRRAVFIRQNNLWLLDVRTGRETQLTHDGAPDFGYATDNAGWTHSDKPIVVWSPDSRKLATFQQDQRNVGRMYLVSTTAGHPQLESWAYPFAGDQEVPMIQRVVIDVEKRKVLRLKTPPDFHRSSLCDDVSCAGGYGWDDVQWSADSSHLAYVATSRDHKQETLRIADAATGDVRDVFHESAATYFESGSDPDGKGTVNWRYLSQSNEVLWYSERDNWGHLYLYNIATGLLENQVTHGEGNVTQVLRVDQAARVVYFLAVGMQPGRDPYFASAYRVNFDGSGMKLLTPEDADHAISISPDGRSFLDIASTPAMPQHSLLRDSEGSLLVDVAHQDISRLLATGWRPPEQITVKARDGRTDLYGFLFKPTTFDSAVRYPIIDHVYPGPQTGSCGSRSFSAAHKDMQSLAELGFIVVCIDGMGTPNRSKAFHDALYGDMADNTIPDQVAGIRQLAAQNPWIDLDRVGIYGHSGGGAATAAAMFHAPDFFKVGVSESGNHDNRIYEDDWAEKWLGPLKKNADGTTNYDTQANQNFARNLKGHLLLVHGTMDDNVPLNSTLLVVDALIRANKDFDLLILPNAGHGYEADEPYVTRRRWDYFVRYLAGGVPPHEYSMQPYAAQKAALARASGLGQ